MIFKLIMQQVHEFNLIRILRITFIWLVINVSNVSTSNTGMASIISIKFLPMFESILILPAFKYHLNILKNYFNFDYNVQKKTTTKTLSTYSLTEVSIK